MFSPLREVIGEQLCWSAVKEQDLNPVAPTISSSCPQTPHKFCSALALQDLSLVILVIRTWKGNSGGQGCLRSIDPARMELRLASKNKAELVALLSVMKSAACSDSIQHLLYPSNDCGLLYCLPTRCVCVLNSSFISRLLLSSPKVRSK